MVRVLDSGSSSPGSGPGWGRCVVFLGNTLYSQNSRAKFKFKLAHRFECTVQISFENNNTGHLIVT